MRVFITGGGRGFGGSLAAELGARGHAVVATHRGPPRDAGGVRLLRCDVADEGALRRAAGEAVRAMGGIDVWVNNAAVGVDPLGLLPGPAARDTGAGCPSWPGMAREAVGVNVLGVLVGSHVAAEAGAAHVYNVYGSGHDGGVVPGLGVYSASKAFVSAFTRAAARHRARHREGAGPRPPAFHALVPGPMDTGLLARELSELDPLRAWALLAVAVPPEEAARAAADGMERDVARGAEGYTAVDCYLPCLLARLAGRAGRGPGG